MVDARRRLKLRQTDRGVARPGNARPVAVGRDPRIFPHRQGAQARATRDQPLEPSGRRSACSPLLGALSESLRDHSPLAIRLAGDVDHGVYR